jgi:SAM-dependent methyltransferase
VSAPLAPVAAAAEILYAHGATHVWVFGSRGGSRGAWDFRSDVDVAVAGLSPAAWKRADEAVRGALDVHSDVVRLESASPYIRWSLARDRVLVPRTAAQPAAVPPSIEAPVRVLNDLRHAAVADAVLGTAARSVLDLGCGTGKLLERLATAGLERLTGVDRSAAALRAARVRLARTAGARVCLLEDLIVRRSPLYRGHDAAVAVEVIEHLDPAPRAAFEQVLFDYTGARAIVVTTPNREYNALSRLRLSNGLRHSDHRFEWSRGEFAAWAHQLGERFGFSVALLGVGTVHPVHGPPTQLALFTRGERERASVAHATNLRRTPRVTSD